MDLIERSALLKDLDDLKKSPWYNIDNPFIRQGMRECMSMIENLCIKKAPAVNAEPVRPGKWWRYPLEQLGFPEHVYMMRQCSECKKVFGQKWNYCPNCGAKMYNVKEKDEETEIWHSLKGNVEAPKGTFDKIYEEKDV